jgi:hypothetical protein
MSDLRVVREFRTELLNAPKRPRVRAARLRALALAAAVLALAAGIATAATGAFPIGNPLSPDDVAKPPGKPLEGSEELARVRTPDPVGGPLWGIRTFSTDRGARCQQIGRVVDGRLGLIGDDGRFHELPFTGDGDSCFKATKPPLAVPEAAGDAGIASTFGHAAFTDSGGPAGDYAPDACATGFKSLREANSPGAVACDDRPRRFVLAGTTGPEAVEVRVESGPEVLRFAVVDRRFLVVTDRPLQRGQAYAMLRDGRRGDGLVAWGAAPAAVARRDATQIRRAAVHTTRSTVTPTMPLKLSFRTPRVDGNGFYRYELRGPRGCVRQGRIQFDVRALSAVAGTRVIQVLRPPGPRASVPRAWCRGRYSGTVTRSDAAMRDRVYLGGFTFVVR